MRALATDVAAARTRAVEAPVPVPAPGQILVEVRVSAVNEMDVQVRAGGWARQVSAFRKAGPVLTGFEFAGVARSDGARIAAGQRIIGYSPVLDGPRTHAQFAVIDERHAEPIPDDLSDEDAAALVVMGLTAIEVLERIRPLQPDQRTLVIGAAGGVGIYSVQLAASQGAVVSAVASAAVVVAVAMAKAVARVVAASRRARWWPMPLPVRTPYPRRPLLLPHRQPRRPPKASVPHASVVAVVAVASWTATMPRRHRPPLRLHRARRKRWR